MRRVALTAAMMVLALAGCGGSDGGGLAPAPGPAPAAPVTPPDPTPPTTPPVDPVPPPSSPAPGDTLPPSIARFADLYVVRIGSTGVTLPSACGGIVQASPTPAITPASPFGQGLSFRFIVTPNVWSIGGDLSVGYDGRDAVPLEPGVEVAYARAQGPAIARFSIVRPAISGAGLDYVRLAQVSGAVQGTPRLYRCVLGVATPADQLTSAATGSYPRTVVTGTAQAAGSGGVQYELGASEATIAADMSVRSLTLTLRLQASQPGGAVIALGNATVTVRIDPATGGFTAPLASSDRTIDGTISGRFFGPAGAEVAIAYSATITRPGIPILAIAGAAFGAR
jgi:hypothetical protein